MKLFLQICAVSLLLILGGCTNTGELREQMSGLGADVMKGARIAAEHVVEIPTKIKQQYVVKQMDLRLYTGPKNDKARVKAFERCWADAATAVEEVKRGNEISTAAGTLGGGTAGYLLNFLANKNYVNKIQDYGVFTLIGAAAGFGLATALNPNLQTEVAEPITDACMEDAGFRWTGPPHAWTKQKKKE